jgi:hypothetical protein
MKNHKTNFKAGKYYVGDLCYVVNDNNWDKLLDDTDYFGNNDLKFKDEVIFASNTAYGDGTYYDNKGRKYSVDAGLIGVMPFGVIDENEIGKGGQIIEFEKDFKAYEEDGKFYIDDFIIDTKEDEEENEEEDWDDDEDEEEYKCENYEPKKPKCKLYGQDGNVFNLIGLTSKTLKKAGLYEQADEMIEKCFDAGSYNEALKIIMEYVEVV